MVEEALTDNEVTIVPAEDELPSSLYTLASLGVDEARFRKITEAAQRRQQVLKIFFVGKEGTGKSSLINALIGRQIAKEGAGADHVTGLNALRNPYRNEYVCAAETKVEVEVWDSPGSTDLYEGDAVYQRQMQRILRQVHLVIYCIASGRLDDSTLAAFKKFIEYEPNVISRMIVAITKVNLMMVPETCKEGEESDFFEQEIKKIKDRICGLLKDIHTSCDINGIPFVQTGYYRHTRITPNPLCLHNHCIDWLLIFWFHCLVRCDDASWSALLHLSTDRLRRRKRDGNASLDHVHQARNSHNGQLHYENLPDVMARVPIDERNRTIWDKIVAVFVAWIQRFLDRINPPIAST